MKEFFAALKMEWIASLIEQESLDYIDFALAAQLIKAVPSPTENSAIFLCHLSAAVRRGHLCVCVDENNVWPGPAEIWPENLPHTHAFYEVARKRIVAGRWELPAALLTALRAEDLTVESVQTPLCSVENRIYMQRYWMHETLFLQFSTRFLAVPPEIAFDKAAIEKRLFAQQRDNLLLPAQAKAIANGIERPLTIISGGPGTGKTYTAGQLILNFWESLDVAAKHKFKIALAAPTGKAASNLQKSLLKAAGNVPALEALQATTLHRLLALRSAGESISSVQPLKEDLIIVDESSMIDTKMMATLFAAIKPGARLILLGDQHQLPAVNAGAPFTDLIHMQAKRGEEIMPLNVCLRAELQEIVEFAAAINEGEHSRLEPFFRAKGAVQRISFDDENLTPEAMLHKLCDGLTTHYKYENTSLEYPEALFEQSNRFRALSPMRKGPFGVEQLNALLLKRMKKLCSPGRPFIAPIMMQKNDPQLEVFNGEVGLLVRPNFNPFAGTADLALGDYVLLPAKEGGMRKIPAMLLPSFEYAYCLSVHKSQGSEFEHVFLLLPEGSQQFGREILYTAVTRARRRLDLFAQDGVLEATIARKSYRLSAHTSRD